MRKFWIKLTNWEYWPMEVVYFPVAFYFIWLAFRSRSWLFFSAANPSIETGGMLGEAKMPILEAVPDHLKPKTILIEPGTPVEEILQRSREKGIGFPLICKPNRGERGFLIEKIKDEAHLKRYFTGKKIDIIIQEYADFPVELGVLWYRLPSQKNGEIISIVMKEFLKVMGDGQSTIRQLMEKSDRAVLQLESMAQKIGSRMDEVLPAGKELELEPIGNHARGTKFLSGNHLITPELTAVFDRINTYFDGYYYVRYDMRTSSWEDLLKGENIRILEINGAGAEAAHVYDPAYSKWKAYRDFFRQWTLIFRIARENHRNGTPYMTLKEGRAHLRKMKEYRKLAAS